nr:hypothetical protein [Tanacetum cinerariifolium]
MRGCPFFKAFLVTVDVPAIYMQEFWATTYVHQHSIRFKMDSKKNIVDLEAFREMLHISPRIPGQSFVELPFEEEILDFLRFLGHSAQIKTLTDVNVNKLFHPWRSFAALTTEDIRNTKAYKEYYACAIGEAEPKPKASARRKRGGYDSSTTPPTAHGRSSTNEGTGSKPGVPDEEISKLDEQEDTESGEGDAEETESDEENSEDDGNSGEDQGLRVSEEQRLIEEEEVDELYCDVDINRGRGLQSFVTSMLNPISDAGGESIFMTASSPIEPLQTSTPIMTPSTIATITTSSDAPIPPTTIPSAVLQNLPTFDSVFCFKDRVKSLELNFLEFMQTNQFAEAVSNIPVAADLTEIELKKILIENMEGNKSIQRSDEQMNLYKALVDAYEADKTILESYGQTAVLKRRREDDDDQEGPSAGSDRGSTTGTQSRLMSASESAFAGEPMQTTCQLDEPSHPVFETGQRYPHNQLQPLPLIPNNQGRRVIPFAHFINNDLEYLRGGASSRKYTTSVTKTKAADYGHIKWIEDLFYGIAVNRESALDVYSKRRIIAVTDLKIVEWYNYKHLDWISVHRDDDKIYKFKEGDFKRLRLQDIEDMLLLLVQGKLSNLTVEEHFDFNVSLRMFTRSIVIQRRVEDLQLGVKSYQKRLNLTKPDTYRSDLKRCEAYTAYSNPRGFIYQNKDKKNRLMRIDELHKFNDGTLNDVRNALDDRLNGIRMQYLPQTIWRKGDKDRAAAMIQAIDKMLKTRRIMRSLEWFVGG